MKTIITSLMLALLFGCTIASMAQTTLSVGDVAIVRMNEDSPSDGFSFVTLVPISSGTVIYFAEEGWGNSSWNTNSESHLKYTSTGALGAGTVVHIDETTTADVLSVTGGGGSVTFAWGTSNFNLSGGDQILVYQTSESTKPASPTFIAGLTLNDGNSSTEPNDPSTGWTSASAYTVTGVNVSRLPPGLINGSTCIAVFPDWTVLTEKDNARYNCTLTTGTKSALLTAINNRSNWLYDDAINYPTSSVCSFTVNPAIAPAATTNAATDVLALSATLNGTVNANNESSVVTFEYGLTTAYGTSVTADQSPVTGVSATSVSKTIAGLSPNTTYHFRVKGVNDGGTTYGSDQSFTTTMNTDVDGLVTDAVLLYPNPVTDGFYVNVGDKTTTISIFNLSGNLVLTQQINSKSYINTKHLEQGVYLIKIDEMVGRLVKNK
ncbi:MAG: T9SS type A sorting domain-containing protein [Paludibacter sp.]|nr:T9SS type A sorting domain-containing protein [Paludibacter sp.]